MDDFPAGPASREPRRPPLSVVIPVKDGGRDFERCLRRLRDSSWTDFETVVVDDASTDGSAEMAESLGARVLRQGSTLGPAAARNAGVKAARAPIVFFVDADVALHREALERAMRRFERDSRLAALFGSYDDNPSAPGLVSRFRNLLHHYVHQQGEFRDDARPAHTFWTGCGAIRKDEFLAAGGFDPRLYRRPAIEDIELGYRITAAGGRILLARDVLATHMKRWRLRQVIRTDVFQRGVPWTLLMLRSKTVENDLNVGRSQQFSVAAVGIGLAALAGAPFEPRLLVLAGVAALVQAMLNRRFYGFLARRGGARFALAAFPLHTLYFVCCGASVAIALGLHWTGLGAGRPLRGLGERIDAPGAPNGPVSTRRRRPSRWTRV